MDARLYRRARRSLTGLLVGAFVAGGLWGAPLASARPGSAPQADVPPQEPGVTLRVFDVQVPLEKICTLKPGQTPNVDKLMPTVDWSTTSAGSATTSSPRSPATSTYRPTVRTPSG
jgi:hypothetical protein